MLAPKIVDFTESSCLYFLSGKQFSHINGPLAMKTHFAIIPITLTAMLFAATPTSAQVIANLRGDFSAASAVGNTTQSGNHPQGLPDAGQTGFWNYYTSDSRDPAAWNLVLLTWGKTWKLETDGSNQGYINAKSERHVGCITGPIPAVHDEPAPPAGYCAMHSSGGRGAAIAEWTSATTGNIRISGAVKLAQENKESGVQFWIWKKAADGTVSTAVEALTIRDGNDHPYQALVSVAPGDRIYFVMGPNGSIWADHTHIAATITRQ